MAVKFGLGTSGTTTEDLQAQEFKDLRPILAALLGGSPSGGNPFGNTSYGTPSLTGGFDPYAFASPMTPMGQSLIQSIYAGAFGSPEQDAASKYRTGLIRGDYLTPDPAYVEALQRPVREAYRQEAIGTQDAFTRAGHRTQESSPFAVAKAISDRGLANALSDIQTKLAETGRERQFQAASSAETRDAERTSSAIARLQAVELPRMIADMGIERGLAAFARRLQALVQVTQPALGTSSESTEFNFGFGS